MQQETAKFESWAIVEIMGHIKAAGMCTTQNFGNTVLLRIDIPETQRHPAHTQMYGMGSIFSIKPCDEEMARAHAEAWQVTPVIEYNTSRTIQKRTETMAQEIIDRHNTALIEGGKVREEEDEEEDEDEEDIDEHDLSF